MVIITLYNASANQLRDFQFVDQLSKPMQIIQNYPSYRIFAKNHGFLQVTQVNFQVSPQMLKN